MSLNLLRILSITICALALTVGVGAHAQQGSNQKHHHYKLIDLGTFGGPSSYLQIDNGVNGAPNQVLNSRAIAVGWADTSTPDPYAPNCFNFDCFTSNAFEWQNGTRVDLGALPGGQNSSTSWISDSGLIAGQSQNGVVDPLVPGFPEIRATMWTRDGRIINLGTLGGNESSAFSVNNRGQVVGVAVNNIPNPFSFLATQLRAFLWQDGVMRDLGTVGTGDNAWALFVNERGQVAGFSDTSPNPGPLGVPPVDPFLWEQGIMQDLGTLGGTSGSPLGLNNRGQVVGTSDLSADLATHPFLWTKPGPMQDLGTFGGDNGFAVHINDAGEIAGSADFAGDQIHHATLWRSGVMTDLGTVEGEPCSRAYGINAKAQIVGGSSDCSIFLRAFLWENGGPAIDLNTLVLPGASLTMTIAGYVNDRGEIAGAGFPTGCTAEDEDLCTHAFLLIPCDENHPGIDGCDYSEVEADTIANVATSIPVAYGPITRRRAGNAINESLPMHLMPWRQHFLASPRK
jgi:probable HAF family extracellular repeat protein